MRPRRLELEGFSTFRDRVEIDFSDVDLFAFVGPTGAGKSTVIDAMVFALYGSVPRLGNKLVHPVITQGRSEARVRFDFTVDDVEHTAVRVVRRTKTGASTKEARLERGDDVLAGDAKAMTTEVEQLVGLTLDQFTTCVVLPQGDFARLLHDTPANRQDLLVRLLDLGLYERLASLARAREADARSHAAHLTSELGNLSDATSDRRGDLERRLTALDRLAVAVDEAEPEIHRLTTEASAARQRETEWQTQQARVAAVAAPSGLDRLDAVKTAAADALQAATTADAGTQAEADRLAAGAAELPDPAVIATVRDQRERRADLNTKLDKGAAMIAEAEAQREPLHVAVVAADGALADANAALEAARVSNAAADLASHLHAGDDCPVCQRPLDHDPKVAAADLTRAAKLATAAEAAAVTARDKFQAVEADLAKYRTHFTLLEGQRDELDGQLTGAPTLEQLEQQQAALAQHAQQTERSRQAATAARRALAEAQRQVDAASVLVADAEQRLAETREDLAPVASIEGVPASPARVDSTPAGWAALLLWCEAAQAALAAHIDQARQTADRADTAVAHQRKALHEQFAAAGVHVAGEAFRPAVTDAANKARSDLAVLDERIARAATLTEQLALARETEQVHQLLKSLLGASGFEQWLLQEAVDALVAGAADWLVELSSGAYSLTLDESGVEFCVIDHRDADQVRLARTLSGGETFLASLSLALALAERVSELAAVGAPRLEAIFLDEGFGTLDADTLDVVASAIEELGATGRMVGIVSHVRELADRVPVRFEITRGPTTSTIERVER